jgi:protein associated with RNAse G/E
LIEAFFNRPDKPFHGVLLAEGDRFVERYYSDRWYNIFEIHDRKTDQLKAWYCNVTYPAIMQDGMVIYIDLALDLLVYADGRHLVLDEDEFLELKLGEADERKAREALRELQELFNPPVRFTL